MNKLTIQEQKTYVHNLLNTWNYTEAQIKDIKQTLESYPENVYTWVIKLNKMGSDFRALIHWVTSGLSWQDLLTTFNVTHKIRVRDNMEDL